MKIHRSRECNVILLFCSAFKDETKLSDSWGIAISECSSGCLDVAGQLNTSVSERVLFAVQALAPQCTQAKRLWLFFCFVFGYLCVFQF